MASSIVWNYVTKIDNGSNAQLLKLAIADGSTSSLRRYLQKKNGFENLGNASK